jgi:serine/threonine protein kinase
MDNRFGKYEILRRIGVGGMGMVYLAKDNVLGRQVALKILEARLQEDPNTVKRFLHEAKVSASLTHPNIVVIYDFGVQDGASFIAMEYLPGENLRTFLDRKPPFPFVQKLDVALQVAKALEHAHRNGVVHRDVKPNNIQLLPSGDVKLMDFGIAKVESADLTKTGVTMGTPGYSSPEQIRGHPVTPASDIFSFGVVLYELLSGRKAFTGADMAALLFKIVFEEAQPLEAQTADTVLPESLRALVARCMAKRAEDRYDSFAPVIAELRRLLRAYSEDGYTGSGPIPILETQTPVPGAKKWTPERGVEEVSPKAAEQPQTGDDSKSVGAKKPAPRRSAAGSAATRSTGEAQPTPSSAAEAAARSRTPPPVEGKTPAGAERPGARPKREPARPEGATPRPAGSRGRSVQEKPAKAPEVVEPEPAGDREEALPRRSRSFWLILVLGAVGMAASLYLVTNLAIWLVDSGPAATPTPAGHVSPTPDEEAEPPAVVPPPAQSPREAGPSPSRPPVVLPSDLTTRTPTESAAPSRTPVPPTVTHTPVPPTSTHTPVPPTSTHTPVPPTSTHTPVPPTSTHTPVPPTVTHTPEAPTETSKPTSPPRPTRTPRPTSPPPTETSEPTDTPVPPTRTPRPTDTPFPKVVLEGKNREPKTPEDATIQEMDGIRSLLSRYEAASEKLDASAIADLWPTLSSKQVDQMRKAFAGYSSQKVDITIGQVVIEGATARVRARVKRRIEPKVGRGVEDDREVTIVLKKIGGVWMLEDLR